MSRRARYMTEKVDVPSQFWEGWLTIVQKKAFGWQYTESYTETTHGVDENWKPTEKSKHYKVFLRHSPYTNNLLFKLAEALSNLIIFLRKIIGFLFIPGLIVTFICVFMDVGSETIGAIGGAVIGAPILFILLGLAAALVGTLLRKCFKIEEKLEEEMIANGYDPDSYAEFDD